MTLVRTCLLLWVAAALAPFDAGASSAAGFELELGKFKLQVFYSVALEYPGGADVAVRDPRLALFTVATALQPNAGSFGEIAHTVRIELGVAPEPGALRLDVIEDPEAEGASATVVRQGPFTGDLGREIVSVLCNRYHGACNRAPAAALVLYRCRDPGCRGRLRFGSFPSDALNRGYSLLPPKRRAAPLRVTRTQLVSYFAVLE